MSSSAPSGQGYKTIYKADSIDVDHLVTSYASLEFSPFVNLEKASVYGSVVAMPQIARSTNYNVFFTILASRAYFNFVVNFAIQFLLLTYIGQATQIMAPLGGEMHLCDFGANLDACPKADHCHGPDRTKYTIYRNYGYTQWAVQKFTKNALLDVFPDKKSDIEEKVDPGEYGMESYACRMLCIFVFTTKVVSEVYSIFAMVVLLISVPSGGDPEGLLWINNPGRTEDKATFRVAGMPVCWKIINFLVVLCPKMMLCHFVLWEGTLLLMDTAGILDMVLGAMSMAFVLDIDEIIFDSITSVPTKEIMANLQDYQVYDVHETVTQVPARWLIWIAFPKRVIFILLVMFFYVEKYYHLKCTDDSGYWVSKDMFLPLTSNYHIWDFLFDSLFHTVPRQTSPFYTFDQDGGS